jgi:hypothetical protein
MSTLQKTILMAWAASIALLAVLVIVSVLDSRDRTHDRVVAAAEDFGCTFIEQSYHHPDRFYVECGDGNIQIITLGK